MQQTTIQVPDYTPDIISRNIKRVNDDVIEIKRYSESGVRYLAWSWFLIVIAFLIYHFITNGYLYKEILWSIDPDSRLLPQYEKLKTNYLDLNLSLSELGTYNQFREGMLNAYQTRRYWGFFYIVFPIILFLCVVSPKWRPLRIDTKRRLVYFWLWGQFYITRYSINPHPLTTLYSRMHKPKLRFPEHAALVLKVPHESKLGKFTEVDLGIFRPACKYQNYVLYNFLYDYLISPNPNQEFERYFHKEKTLFSDYLNRFFYRFSLFPDRGYNEEKTEAKIQEWLARNPESSNSVSVFNGNIEQIIQQFFR